MPGLASTPSTPVVATMTKRPIFESPTPFPSAPALQLARPEYPFWIATYNDLPLELQTFLADNGIYNFAPDAYDTEDVDAARVYLAEELYSTVREVLAIAEVYPKERLNTVLQQVLEEHMLRFDALLCFEIVVREELGEQVEDAAVNAMRQLEMDDKIGFMLRSVAGTEGEHGRLQ